MKHVILVTGAGKGIGRAISVAFARAFKERPGFEPVLLLCSRSREDLESVALECRNLGAETDIVACDIASMHDVNMLAEKVLRDHGTIDCLVNNAGVGRFKPLGEITEEDFDYTISTNLKGTFFLTQALFPHMAAKRSGHIFFITSVAAEKAFRNSSVYCMSKFGQKGLVETMRLYARECGVRITDVMPGAVFTPMWGEAGEEMKPRMMMPEDIAEPVVQAYLQPGRTTVEEIVLRPTCGDVQDE